MLNDVRLALLELRNRQNRGNVNTVTVDGFSGFVFTRSNGNIINPTTISKAMLRMRVTYNVMEEKQAAAEGREPDLIEVLSPHILRHTFCTRLCENVQNLKVIQEVMGHANIELTMNVYNEATLDKKKESFENLEGKVLVGL